MKRASVDSFAGLLWIGFSAVEVRFQTPFFGVYQKGTEMKKIDIRKLPELKTSVGIHGSIKQKEVGGAACMGAIFMVAIA